METRVVRLIHTHSKERQPESKKLILVIDDSRDIQLLNRAILETEGYEVFTASSGKDALTLLAEAAPPDLILLDIRMDDMSGPEFLEILEKERPEILKHVPVVFLSGTDEIPKSKATGFIRKPIDLEPFLERISHFLEVGRRLH